MSVSSQGFPRTARTVMKRDGVPRGQFHPTTADVYYTDAEIEFLLSVDDYKRRSGRQFPTLADLLRILVGLGYSKPPVDS